MREYPRKRLPLDACPVELTLGLIQGKWTARLLFLLLQRACHFGELKRLLPGISAEVLSARLAALRRDGLVECSRDDQVPGAPLSMHALTARGRSLVPALQALADWGLTELAARGDRWDPPVLPPKRARAPRAELHAGQAEVSSAG